MGFIKVVYGPNWLDCSGAKTLLSNGFKRSLKCDAIARLVGSESGMIQQHMGHCRHVERASIIYKQTNSINHKYQLLKHELNHKTW